MLGDSTAEQLRQAHQGRLGLIQDGLQALNLQYPTYALWLQEDYLGRIARRLERERYGEMLQQSLISGEVYADLLGQLNTRWNFLDRDPPLDIEMGATELIGRVPLLQGMPSDAQRAVTRLLKPRLFLPDQLILGPTKPAVALYFVASGAVTVLLPDGTHVELGSGEFFGEIYLLSNEKLEFEVRSLGYSKLLCLSAKDFKALLARDTVVRESIELVAKQRMRALEVWRIHASSAVTPPSAGEGPLQ